jgi:hypothetical protein
MEALEAIIPYEHIRLLTSWRRYGVIEVEEFTESGVRVRGRVPPALEAILTGIRSGATPAVARDVPSS